MNLFLSKEVLTKVADLNVAANFSLRNLLISNNLISLDTSGYKRIIFYGTYKGNKKPSFPRRRESRSQGLDSCFRRNDRECRIYPYQTKYTPGFTLIEVLIAVAILSIILAAIYSTFFLSHRAIEGMDESLLKLQESRKAIDILRRELDSAFYRLDEDNTFLKIQDRDIYGKQAAKLIFTTFSTLRPGLSRISYYIEEKDGRLNLFKKIESPYFNESNPPSPPFSKGGLGGFSEETQGVDIIENLEAFTVEAMYNGKWVKTWDTDITKDIPGEIRICLSMMIKGRKVDLFDVSRPRVGKTI